MKYLEFYKRCLKTGELPSSGLCGTFYEDMKYFDPPKHPLYYDNWFWAYDGEPYGSWCNIPVRKQLQISYKFTPLRQNIVLLMAAMAGEL